LAEPGHQAAFGQQDAEHLEAIESLFRRQEFHPPSLEEICRKTRIPEPTGKRLLGILREHGRLVPVGEGLLFHREAVDHARKILIEHVRKEGKLESVDFKYLLDTSRKFAIPMLDHLDRLGDTRRVGNTRYPKTPSK